VRLCPIKEMNEVAPAETFNANFLDYYSSLADKSSFSRIFLVDGTRSLTWFGGYSTTNAFLALGMLQYS